MRSFTNEIVNITDDHDAQAVMLELGILNQVRMQADHPVTVAAIISTDHPTHWCLCVKHQGNPDPDENGFQVVAYPKSQVPLSTVHLALQNYFEPGDDLSIYIVGQDRLN